MSNLFKKLTIVGLGLAMVVSLIAPLAVVNATTILEGDLVKVEGNTAVYLIQGTTKRTFPHESIYYTWYTDFSTVKTITADELDSYTLGNPVPYRAGTAFRVYTAGDSIGGTSGRAVFVMGADGKVLPVQDEETYVKFFAPTDTVASLNASKVVGKYTGEMIYKGLFDVPGDMLARFSYPVGANLTTASVRPEGILFKVAGSDATYIIRDGKKCEISAAGITANGYDKMYVVAGVPVTETFTAGVAITGEVAALKVVPTWTEAAVTGGPLTAALSANTPAAGTSISNGLATPFTTVTLTAGSADVTVSSFTIRRTGLGSYLDFSRLYVVADGVRHGNFRSIATDDSAELIFSTGGDTITIPAGTSKDVSVYANMDTVATGQGVAGNVNAIRITAIGSSASAVNGLPVTGNSRTVSAAAAPTATVAGNLGAQSVDIGAIQIAVSQVKITNTNANEDISVRGITMRNIAPAAGTRADSSDVTNFTAYVDSVAVSGGFTLQTDNYIHIVFNSPVTIEKGGSKFKTFDIKADVKDGPARILTLDFTEYITGHNSDVDMVGMTNNQTVFITDSFTAAAVTVNNSDLVVTDDVVNNPKARTILDDQDVTLLKGYFNAAKGSVTITGVTVALTGSGISYDDFDNLKLYVNGTLRSQEASPFSADTQTVASTTYSVAWTDEFNVIGKVPFELTINANTVTDAVTLRATVTGSSGVTATRDSDGAAITPSGTATGNIVTFNAATLTPAIATNPPSVTRVAGSKDIPFLGFTMSAGTAGEVTIKTLNFNLSSTADSTITSGDVINVRLYDNSGNLIATKEFNSSKVASFTGLNLKIPASGSAKYIVKADLASTITSGVSDAWIKLVDADGLTNILAYDKDNNQITVTTHSVNNAGTISVTIASAGTLDVELTTASPVVHQVVAATTGDLTGYLKFYAEYEDVSIKKIILTASSTTAGGFVVSDQIDSVTIRDGSLSTSPVIGTVDALISNQATFLLDPYIKVPAGQNKTLRIETSYNSTDGNLADPRANIRWSVEALKTDIEAVNALSTDIYAALRNASGTGAYVSTSAETFVSDTAGTTATTLTVAAITGFNVGDLILIDNDTTTSEHTYEAALGDEYALITALPSATTMTVRRGVAGSTAIAIADGENAGNNVAIYNMGQAIRPNAVLLYSNLLKVTDPGQAAKTVLINGAAVDALRFTLTPQAGIDHPIKLKDITIQVSKTTSTATWDVGSAELWNMTNNSLVGSVTTTGPASLTYKPGTTVTNITFNSLYIADEVDATINLTPVTYKVILNVSGNPGTTTIAGDSLRASLASFGSATVAGGITAGSIVWLDSKDTANTDIAWIADAPYKLDGVQNINQ